MRCKRLGVVVCRGMRGAAVLGLRLRWGLAAAGAVWAGGGVAAAQGPTEGTIDRAVAWLVSPASRNAAGTWGGGEREAVATSEVLRALVEVREAGRPDLTAEINAIRSAVEAYPATDHARLALKIAALSAAGGSVGSLRTDLLDAQNVDGGWGLAEVKRSNIVDTALATDALLGAGLALPEPVLVEILGHFVATQAQVAQGPPVRWNWPIAGEGPESGAARAAVGLLALRQIGAALPDPSPTLVARGRAEAFLVAVLSDGPALATLTASERAVMLRALAGLRAPADLNVVLGALLSRQREDGSFDGDPFATAAAIRALLATVPHLGEDMADLAVLGETFEFLDIDPNAATLLVKARVANLGGVESGGCLGNVYDGDPGAGGVPLTTGAYPIDPIPAGGWTFVEFYVPRTAVSAYIAADVQHDVREHSEANNVAGRPVPSNMRGSDLIVTPGDLRVERTATGVRLRATVRHAGRPLGADPFRVDFYFGAGAGFPSGPPVASFNCPGAGGCPPGEVPTYEHTITLPPAPAPHGFRVVVDYAQDVDEDNNDAFREFQLRDVGVDANIQVTSVAWVVGGVVVPPPGPAFGTTAQLRVEGTTSGGVSGQCELTVIRGSSPSAGGWLATSAVTLPAGPWSFDTAAFTVPYGSEEAGVLRSHVGAWIDADDGFFESSELDNYGFTVAERGLLADPMIVPDSLEVSHVDLAQGSVVRLRVTARNVGHEPVSGGLVRFESQGVLLGDAPLGTLAPLGSEGDTAEVEVLWAPRAGEQTASATIVLPAGVEEITNRNNSDSRSFTFSASEVTIELAPRPDQLGIPPGGTEPVTAYHGSDEALEGNLQRPAGVQALVSPVGPDPNAWNIEYIAEVSLVPEEGTPGTALQLIEDLDRREGNLGEFPISLARLKTLLAPGFYTIRANVTRYDSHPETPPGDRYRPFGSAVIPIEIGATTIVSDPSPFVLVEHVEPGQLAAAGNLTVLVFRESNVPFTATLAAWIEPGDCPGGGTYTVPPWDPQQVQFAAGNAFDPATRYFPLPDDTGFCPQLLPSDTLLSIRAAVSTPPDSPDPFNRGVTEEQVCTVRFHAPTVLQLFSKTVQPTQVPPRDGEQVHSTIIIRRAQ